MVQRMLIIAVLILSLIVPLAAAAQEATPAPATTIYSVAIDVGLLSAPGGTAQLGHSIDQPGWHLAQRFPYAGVVAVTVVLGAFTVSSEGPVVVVGAGSAAATPQAAPAGQAVTVHTGETVFFRSDVRTEQRNDGTEPCDRYWLVVAAGQPDLSEASGDSSVDNVWTLDPANWQLPPSGPVTITMRAGDGAAPAGGPDLLVATRPGGWLTVTYAAGTAADATAIDLGMGGTPTAG